MNGSNIDYIGMYVHKRTGDLVEVKPFGVNYIVTDGNVNLLLSEELLKDLVIPGLEYLGTL
jgi:hypothetical protein